MKSLSVQERAQKRKEVDSIPLIDVRTPAEFGSVHAEGAVNHPMESLDVERLLFGKEDEIQVICQSGGRSMKVCQKTGGCWIFECRKCGGGNFSLAGKWIAGG